ncbi:MAG TPA: DpnII family type II restriction endonuclease [Syntrophorhabdaceae bacterium]|nr:DpnII family type II restriction endonuclease [Syntrophorhabdaceae bacterium]HOL06045.1 DpnII family type II restriction endonuclease [Syntrophorhabdaceae bacterium]HON86061.1 DpnII family type II restriction endonuclease [Syntrophorhabdaceae bacterium]HOT42060.1 DpnII family type II restriction endonuclease [Syntrophorhabdaceae bacterium]HPC66784.1 DpnII family type II restriction endonuclease [Syntrophorhabdaceae bacterium]
MKRLVFPNIDEKFSTVISKNTFYFYNEEFEDYHEGHISSIAQNIFLLKNRIEQNGLKESVLLEHIRTVEDGLDAVLTITGFSKESLQRLITFIRVSEDKTLSELVNKFHWPEEEFRSEWGLDKIKSLIKTNEKFAEGIVNLFFRGPTVSVIKQVLPLFEFKKLDIRKFSFSVESLVDTIIRYKTKGSYKAAREGNPEVVIEEMLVKNKLSFEKGKFRIPEAGNIPRTMDFIVPNKTSPNLIIECSYSVTTASGMGDKAKTEKTVADYLKKNYPEVVFVGFVDGIGWYVRRGDLKRMVDAYDFVFTFHKEEIIKFENLLRKIFYEK